MEENQVRTEKGGKSLDALRSWTVIGRYSTYEDANGARAKRRKKNKRKKYKIKKKHDGYRLYARNKNWSPPIEFLEDENVDS